MPYSQTAQIVIELSYMDVISFEYHSHKLLCKRFDSIAFGESQLPAVTTEPEFRKHKKGQQEPASKKTQICFTELNQLAY